MRWLTYRQRRSASFHLPSTLRRVTSSGLYACRQRCNCNGTCTSKDGVCRLFVANGSNECNVKRRFTSGRTYANSACSNGSNRTRNDLRAIIFLHARIVTCGQLRSRHRPRCGRCVRCRRPISGTVYPSNRVTSMLLRTIICSGRGSAYHSIR